MSIPEFVNEANIIQKIDKLAKANKYGTVDGTQMNGETAREIIAMFKHPKMNSHRNQMLKMKSHELADLTVTLVKPLKIKVESVNEALPKLKFGGQKDNPTRDKLRGELAKQHKAVVKLFDKSQGKVPKEDLLTMVVNQKRMLGYLEDSLKKLKESVNEKVGTKKYDGKAWYWPHDYRHYLRDASFKQRKAVHNAWVKIGVPVKKTKDGEKWLEPKSNQKKKAWTIVRKAIAPKELGTPIPESVNEKISKEEWAQYPKYARKLKPYLQKLFKVPLKVRVIKHAFSNPWIEIRVAKFGKDIIPNDFRVKAAKAIGASNVRDWDNVNYGNIRVNSISLKHDIWVKLLGNKVKV